MKIEYGYYKISGIYKIINVFTNDFYIGSSTNLYGRIAQHKSLLKNNIHPNYLLQMAWNSTEESNFKVEILEIVLEDFNLERLEFDYILKMNPGYNINKVTDEGNILISEDTKTKIGIKSAEKFINNPKLIEQARQKAYLNIAGWNKGKTGIYSEEQIKNLSEKAFKRWTNLSESDKLTLDKLKAASVLARKRRERAILQYDLNGNFIKEWTTAKEASIFYKAKSSGNFVKALKQGITLYKSKWKYKNN